MTVGALNNEVVGSHTDVEWSALIRQWKWRCFYCGTPICKNSLDKKTEVTKDHMLPISRGGSDFIWNIVPACLRCNQLKGTMTVDEFRAIRPGAQRTSSVKEIHFSTAKNTAATEAKSTSIATAESVQKQDVLPPEMPGRAADMKTLLGQWRTYCERLKAMNDGYPDAHDKTWYESRRNQLRAQAAGIKRIQLEEAGQQVLPIFGDGIGKKLAQSEEAILPFRGMAVQQ